MRIVMALGALILLPSLALGQGAPGTNIIVDVRVTEVAMLANRARVEYVLESSAESIEQLFQFTVDAPSPVLSILRPQPEQDWKTRTVYRTRSVARWTVLGEQMAPGDVSPPLVFEAVGLPGIVTHRVRGYVPPPPLTDAGPVVTPSDPLIENSVPGMTVGVEPLPDDLRPINLVKRLRELTDQTCGDLGWITNRGVCKSLKKKLENAERSLERDRTNAAKGRLGAFRNELDDQRGKHVNDSAYWLLRTNAEFVLSQLIGRIPGLTPFAAFEIERATLELDGEGNRDDRARFEVRGSFVLANASDGIDPVNQEVIVTFDGFSQTIPAGSFVRGKDDGDDEDEKEEEEEGDEEDEGHDGEGFRFDGAPGGITRIEIRDDGRFRIKARGLELSGLDFEDPVIFSLQIGSDLGEAAIEFDRDGRFRRKKEEGEGG